MGMKIRHKVVNRMIELVGQEDSGWESVVMAPGGCTVRYTWIVTTMDRHRRNWNEDTYNEYVFLTVSAGKFTLGTSTAPWMGRQDSTVPLWLAEAILEDPGLGLDSHRQLQMRAARRGERS